MILSQHLNDLPEGNLPVMENLIGPTHDVRRI